MKKSLLILTIALILTAFTISVLAQKKSGELKKLENQIEQLEKLGDLIEVKLKVDEQDPEKISIVVERDISGLSNIGIKTITKNSKLIKIKEELPPIDLGKLEITDEYVKEKIRPENPKCGKIDGVAIQQVGVTKDYMVLKDYTYKTNNNFEIKVLKGFVYDRASIPRVFWAIIDKDSLGNVAPLIHDIIYRYGGSLPENQVSPYKKFSKDETDLLFLEIMTKCGVSKVRRELAYQAVSLFGLPAWNGSQTALP